MAKLGTEVACELANCATTPNCDFVDLPDLSDCITIPDCSVCDVVDCIDC
jgi:hypothetical protein